MRVLIFFCFYTPTLFSVAQKDVISPLVENKGQWPEQVLFASDVSGGKIFIEDNAVKYHFFDLSGIQNIHDNGLSIHKDDIRFKGHVYTVRFVRGNSDAITTAEGKQTAYYNYFLGADESRWAGGCNGFERIIRRGIYAGIDFAFYTTGHTMKYDFMVAPGADVSDIQMLYEDIDAMVIENGRIKISTSVNEIYEQKPIAWQVIDGEKQMVNCRYELNGKVVSFSFPNGYNKKYELVIDPELVFSTYSGSYSNNFGYTATYDKDGNLYAGGSAFGQGYPTTMGAYQVTFQGGHSTLGGIDMGLTKYNSSGTGLIWSTFLGGAGDDLPHSLVVNNESELFVYGTTGSSNYPITQGAIDNSFGGGAPASSSGTGANFPYGSDIVVTHFNQACSALLGSTYIGGSANDGLNLASELKHNYADEFRGEILLDTQGNPIIISSTFSSDFPMQNAFQNMIGGQQDGVIMKLNPNLNTILWSSYIGGSGNDSGFSGAVNEAGEIYICGGTSSSNFLTQHNTLQIHNAGGAADGFVVKLNSNGHSIASSTFWGSDAYDQLYFIEVDNEGFVYVFGQTRASASGMIINALYGTPNSGNLLTKFSSDLSSVVWSSVFGTGNGKPNLSPSAFLVDYCNRIYISGWGITQMAGNPLNPSQNLYSMANMPVTEDAYDATCSSGDFYMAVFDENMSQLEYGTFFGGNQSSEHVDGGTSRFDRKGVIYQSVCAGCGGFDDFPHYPSNAWSAQNNNSCNNGVYKFDFQLPLTIADFDYPPLGCTETQVQFSFSGTYAQTYFWEFGDGSSSTAMNPTHNYAAPGLYEVMLSVYDNTTCNSVDTIYKTIQIESPVIETLDDIHLCAGENSFIGLGSSNPNYQYQWQPSQYLSNTAIASPMFQSGVTTEYTLTIQKPGCADIYHQLVSVTELELMLPSDTTLCDEESVILQAFFSPSDASVFWSDEALFGTMLNDNPSDGDIVVSPVVPSTYYVKVSANGCELSGEVSVNLVSFQTVVQGDFVACVGDTVQLYVQDFNPSFEYSWQPDEFILSGQNSPSVLAVVTEQTIFTVTSETPDGCVATDDVEVSVSNLYPEIVEIGASPIHIVHGQSSQLTVQPGGYNYFWTPSSSLNSGGVQNPIATPEVSTTYSVTIHDGECAASKLVTVYVSDFVCGRPTVYVPNTFTPNADDKNEVLFVRANQISKLYFVIYDRWGEKIFETESLTEGWDGSFRGRALDPDVYVYYLEITCVGGEEYFEQGNITLIR